MLISKSDIKEYVQFTLNIENRIIDPSIKDAQEYDLRVVVGDTMYFQFLNDFDTTNLQNWAIATAYLTNDFVIYGNKVYKALTNTTGDQPDISPAEWVENELGTFFITFIKPFLVFKAFARFMTWVGRNITQYGLREMNEETSNPVDEEGRQVLIVDIKGKASIWYSRMKNYLSDVHWTFDTIKYDVDSEDYKEYPTKTFRIRSVDKKNHKSKFKYNNQGGIDWAC